MRILKFTLPLLIAFTLQVNKVQAQEEVPIGLFVYNFTRLFDWPETTKSGKFLIQVLGHQSVHTELARITTGKLVGTQGIEVQNIDSPDQISKQAQIIFIGHWQSRHLPAILEKIDTSPCLLISEMEDMLDKGAAINFIIRENKLVFEMKQAHIDKYKIKTDRRIRELAYRVED